MADFTFLEDYQINDLVKLKAEVETRIESMRGEAIVDLRRVILDKASFLGIQPHELLASQAPKASKSNGNGSKEPLPAKYRDPASGKTWSGKGKRPGWFDSERIHEFRI